MELAGYRENLALLQEMFPDRAVISLPECAKVLGLNIKTVYETVEPYHKNPIPTKVVGSRKRVVPITGLARWMCLKK